MCLNSSMHEPCQRHVPGRGFAASGPAGRCGL